MKDFNALIFDVDGTMAETEELHRRAFNESFVKFGLDWMWDLRSIAAHNWRKGTYIAFS
jgi:beta-phosphoglucomutase-like phosphatase (HAD superfamily)